MRGGKSEFYAFLFIGELKNNPKVALIDIATKFDIPSSFLYKIALKLKKAGIISSKEGVDGGYKLSKDITSISLYDIANALNVQKSNHCMCDLNKSSECIKHEICDSYINLKDNLDQKLKEIKLDNT